jgi:hypothetical protein
MHVQRLQNVRSFLHALGGDSYGRLIAPWDTLGKLRMRCRGGTLDPCSAYEDNTMDAFMPLVIGITAALGFVALGLGVFVMGTPASRDGQKTRSSDQ